MDGRDGRTAGTDGRQGRTAGTDGRDRRRDQGTDGRDRQRDQAITFHPLRTFWRGRTARTDGRQGQRQLRVLHGHSELAQFFKRFGWKESCRCLLTSARQTFSTVARIWLLSGGDAINPSEQIANEPAACPRGHLETTNFVIRCCV
ncbi:uncharacterized protein LOC144088668 isoform X3 [Stigmatopora argus]